MWIYKCYQLLKQYMGQCDLADSAPAHYAQGPRPEFQCRAMDFYLHQFISVCKFQSHMASKHREPFPSLSFPSWVRRPSGWGTKVLLFLFYSKVSSQSHSTGAALGAFAPGGWGNHRVPANIPPDAGHRREQAHKDPLPEDRREFRGQLLAKYRRQTSVDCVAAAAGDQLGHRD